MYDEELEKIVLFYMIFENAGFDLTEKDFASSKHQSIVKAIKGLRDEDTEVSMLSVAQKFGSRKQDVLKYLSDLNEYVFGSSAESSYNRLVELSKKRQVYELLLSRAKQLDNEKTDVLIEKTIKELQQISQRNEQTVTFREQVDRTMAVIEDNYKKRSDYSLYTGIVNLDKMMLGLHEQELTVIGARPRSWQDNACVADCGAYCEKGKTHWFYEFGNGRYTVDSKDGI